MYKSLLGLCLSLASASAFADTSYTCESIKGDRVVIQFLVNGEGTSMDVELSGEKDSGTITRRVFPYLNPFLQKDSGELVSLTHVADMISYSEAVDKDTELKLELETETKKESFTFPFVRVAIALDEKASSVRWDLIDFGDDSKSFEIICDKKGAWNTIHETLSL